MRHYKTIAFGRHKFASTIIYNNIFELFPYSYADRTHRLSYIQADATEIERLLSNVYHASLPPLLFLSFFFLSLHSYSVSSRYLTSLSRRMVATRHITDANIRVYQTHIGSYILTGGPNWVTELALMRARSITRQEAIDLGSIKEWCE